MTSVKGAAPTTTSTSFDRSHDAAAIGEAVLEAARSATRMPMVLADPSLPDFPVVFCNDAFIKLFGYGRDEILGRNLRLMQGAETDPGTIREIREALAARKPYNGEIYNYRKDGSGFWNALLIIPVTDATGTKQFFYASQVDLTARKQAEMRQARQAESLAALTTGVAHEFNNLMTVVLGSVEGARQRSVDDRQREQLERADWGARKAGHLSSQLLAIAKPRADAVVKVDVNRVVSEAKGAMVDAARKGVGVALDLHRGPVLARLDPDQLEAVILSLVRNASDAMPEGGLVTVGTGLPLNGAGEDRQVIVSVSDTGHGMPPEIAARATEAFFTTKDREAGAGLGLFRALQFVEQSGGRLVIETTPARGTTVALRFPVALVDR